MSGWGSIAKIAEAVKAGEVTAAKNVERALKSIESIEEKTEFHAIIATTADRARVRAKEIDEGDKTGRLAGVPFIAKDNFLAFGAETTAASNILKGFEAPYQATAIERLEAEGAICVAKANLDEFAHGSSTENSAFGPTLNPHDKTRVPGGSSGGSSTAVALELVPFALGSDTGGSIRLPASFCGVVGYKPTYGLVSRSGVVAMASSTDCIGPLARSVEDTALLLDVMASRDTLDSTTIERDTAGYILDQNYDLKAAKIGLVKEYMSSDGLEAGVKQKISEAVEKLRAAGATIEEVSLPSLPLALAVYYVLCPAEVSSNLMRYDGQRYGFSYKDAKNLDENYTKTRTLGFGKEAKRRIMIGTHVLSSGYYDAYYKKAQTVRTKLINEFAEAFSKHDFLLGPTAASVAFQLGSHTRDPLQMYLTDIMTVAANLVGNPGISLPAGTVDGLPVGLHIMAAQRQDRQMLEFSQACEGILA